MLLRFDRPVIGFTEWMFGVPNDFRQGVDGFCHSTLFSFHESGGSLPDAKPAPEGLEHLNCFWPLQFQAHSTV
jgi:hypothetical protein